MAARSVFLVRPTNYVRIRIFCSLMDQKFLVKFSLLRTSRYGGHPAGIFMFVFLKCVALDLHKKLFKLKLLWICLSSRFSNLQPHTCLMFASRFNIPDRRVKLIFECKRAPAFLWFCLDLVLKYSHLTVIKDEKCL